MFEHVTPPPGDAILAIMAEYAADQRPDKIDLGVGVYKDDTGATPIMPSVLEGEARVAAKQTTKTYMGMIGDREFNRLMGEMLFSDSVGAERIGAVQTPGGSGALRVLFEYLSIAAPDAIVHMPDPTWANHVPVAKAAGMQCKSYPYFDPKTRLVDFDAMVSALEGFGPNDVVLFHGCCHNPTGADLSPEQWDRVGEIAVAQGFVPFVDIAYAGFGDGLDADCHGLRSLASRVDEMLVAASCSKNFSIYRERTGVAFVVGKNAEAAQTATASMAGIARISYSMPPDHGAAIVREILSEPALKAQWIVELEETRTRIVSLREALVKEFRRKTNSSHYDFIAEHRGMFTVLGLTPDEVRRLKEDHAIYIVGDSRINMAGLKESDIPRFVEGVLAVAGMPS